MEKVRAVIADDERLMREQLRARLADVWPELEIVAEAKNGREAVDAVAAHHPDLAFLDIRMPGMTGVEAAREIGGACHVVFITAYSEYAVEAFDQGAVDYVLKPADSERLAVTVARLKKRLGARPADLGALLEKLAAKLDLPAGAAPPAAGKGQHLQWIQASMGQQIRMIPVAEVLFFTSDEKYTRVQTETSEALIRKPIKELVEELDRRRQPRPARQAAGAAEELPAEARSQPQLHSPVQADVTAAAGEEAACRCPGQPCSACHICWSRSAVQTRGWLMPPASSSARETSNGRQCS
jgi:DNA-binding LytR/AlgR family response regulator